MKGHPKHTQFPLIRCRVVEEFTGSEDFYLSFDSSSISQSEVVALYGLSSIPRTVGVCKSQFPSVRDQT